jgi:hypothetical protein
VGWELESIHSQRNSSWSKIQRYKYSIGRIQIFTDGQSQLGDVELEQSNPDATMRLKTRKVIVHVPAESIVRKDGIYRLSKVWYA